jgi:hypothetical protein
MLSGFTKDVFPSMPVLLGERTDYTWTLWQSEWALRRDKAGAF